MLNKKTNHTRAAKILDLVKIDSNVPLPVNFNNYAFTAIQGSQYIPYLAPGDNLFQTLLTLRLLSTTQGNCINDKTFYSVGGGLQVMDQDFPKDFDKKLNKKRQTIDDLLKITFDSIYQDGNKFIEVVRTTVLKTKYINVYCHNNLDCRFKYNEDGSDPTHVIRSKQFRQNGIISKLEDPIVIPLWTDDPIDKVNAWAKDPKNKNVERTMLHIKNDMGIDDYGLPSNFAGFIDALLEYKIGKFNIDNFDNNWFLAGMLFLDGSFTPQEEKQLLQKLKKMYTGDGKYNRIMTFISDQDKSNTKFVPFSESHEGSFIELSKRTEEMLIGANGWSKSLLDMNESGGLGKGGEIIKQLFQMKFQTVIQPAQANVLNNFVFPLMQIIDEWKDTHFHDLPWYIKPVIPVSLQGVLDIDSLLTVDEGREELGKKPLDDKEKGKMLISEVAPNKPAPGAGGADNTDPANAKTKKKK